MPTSRRSPLPKMVRASHIVCNIDEKRDEASARAAIDRAQAELAKGRPFSENRG